jgi:L-histidine N-alpha-methyltransferase
VAVRRRPLGERRLIAVSAALTVDVRLDGATRAEHLVSDARAGLTSTPKELSPVWFYDDWGSELFDRITRLPEYYLSRAERSLLDAHAPEIAATTNADTVVEIGSGTSEKTTVLLDALAAHGTLRAYGALDVSEQTLREAAERLAMRYRSLSVHGVVGDFHHDLDALPTGDRRLVAFLGSTIGNLKPHERRRFFFDLDCAMSHQDRLLVGFDLVKSPDRLVAAYDDAEGVTAEFNRNALRVMNRELGADFDIEAFDHVAVWNAEQRWIEMRLRARTAQVVRVPGLPTPVLYAAGEEMITEISAKFTADTISAELLEAGFVVEQQWCAGADFALVLARPWC